MDDEKIYDEAELQVYLQEASELADGELWVDAFELLREAEDRFPEDATLLCMLGTISAEVDAEGLASDYYRRCLAAQPEDPHLLVTAGVGLARIDDPDAEPALRLAAALAPDLPLTRLHYGAYLVREGLVDDGLRELEAARALDAEDPRIVRELGGAFLLQDRLPRAVEELERAVGLAPEDGEIRLLYGLALLQADRGEESAEELHRAASLLPEDGEAQLVSALASASQEWDDEAWGALARAEHSAIPAGPALTSEVEEALEGGAAPAAELLRDAIGPAILRDRLRAPS